MAFHSRITTSDRAYLKRLREEFGVAAGDDAIVGEYAIEALVNRHQLKLKQIYQSLNNLKASKDALERAIFKALDCSPDSEPVQGVLRFKEVNEWVVRVLNSSGVKDEEGTLLGAYERILGVILGIERFPEESDLVFQGIPLEVKYAERSIFQATVPKGGVMVAFYNQHIKPSETSVKFAMFGAEGQLEHYFTRDESLNRRGKVKMNRLNGVLVRR